MGRPRSTALWMPNRSSVGSVSRGSGPAPESHLPASEDDTVGGLKWAARTEGDLVLPGAVLGVQLLHHEPDGLHGRGQVGQEPFMVEHRAKPVGLPVPALQCLTIGIGEHELQFVSDQHLQPGRLRPCLQAAQPPPRAARHRSSVLVEELRRGPGETVPEH